MSLKQIDTKHAWAAAVTNSEKITQTFKYFIIAVVTFLIAQALVVVMHELTHSTVAWGLGRMQNPLGIVWGNFLTLNGWDEGVEYSKIFASGHPAVAAIIGISPLVMHTIMVISGIVLMQKKRIREKKWFFHSIYWFVIAHFMELIAYITMRPFATHGDTGIFNRGLKISPWFLFVLGSLAIGVGLTILFKRIIPHLQHLFANENRLNEGAILMMSAYALFVWGSGLRVVKNIYPDPQWMFGLWGFAAFVAVPFIFKPYLFWGHPISDLSREKILDKEK